MGDFVPVRDNEFIAELRCHWRVLLVAFACLLFAFSAPAFLIPFLYPEVIREFGWTREQAVFLASSKYLTGALVSIVVGRVIDVVGVKSVLVTVSAIGGVALLSFLWTPNLGVYYAAGILLGFSGAGTMVSIKVLISRVFHHSQGTAMGIAMLGTSLGSIAVPLVLTYLFGVYGWRSGVALLSAGVWLVALPLTLWLLSAASLDVPAREEAPPASFNWALARQFAAAPGFWHILFAVFAAGFVDQAFIQHQVLYLREDLGMQATMVAAAISAIGLVGLGARPLVGGLFDSLSVRGVSLSYQALSIAAVVALGALNPTLFVLFIVFRAVGHSAVLLDTLVLAKHAYGLTNIGILLGIYTAAVNVGFAAGPPVVARLYAMTGSYLVPFLLCAVIGVIAAAVLLPVKPRYWLAQRGDPVVAKR